MHSGAALSERALFQEATAPFAPVWVQLTHSEILAYKGLQP